ncbi:hypothetical protein D3C76_1553850 [compost metagenome]
MRLFEVRPALCNFSLGLVDFCLALSAQALIGTVLGILFQRFLQPAHFAGVLPGLGLLQLLLDGITFGRAASQAGAEDLRRLQRARRQES